MSLWFVAFGRESETESESDVEMGDNRERWGGGRDAQGLLLASDLPSSIAHIIRLPLHFKTAAASATFGIGTGIRARLSPAQEASQARSALICGFRDVVICRVWERFWQLFL